MADRVNAFAMPAERDWHTSGDFWRKPKRARRTVPRAKPAPKADPAVDPIADFLAFSEATGRDGRAYKWTDQDVALMDGDPVFERAACAYLDTVRPGDATPFIRAIQDARTRYRTLTSGQIRGVCNYILANRTASAQRPVDAPEAAREAPIAEVPFAPIAEGIYTVVLESGHVTIRLRRADPSYFQNLAPGTLIAAYLSGPDNETAYTGFAFVTGTSWRVWSRFRAESRLTEALGVLVHGDWKEAGKRYALASGKCWRCNRTLTVPESIAAGIGPECATMV